MNINLNLKDRIGAVKDIDQLVTDLVQAEKYSEQLEVEYQNIFNLAPDVIIKADLKGFVTSCNQAFSTLSGFTQEEIIGKHFTKLPTLRPKDIPKYISVFSSLMRGKSVKPFLTEWIDKQGTRRTAETHVSIIRVDGKMKGSIAILRDITELEGTATALAESERNLNIYLESAPDAVYISDLKGVFLYGNKKAEELTGYQREELLGKSFLNLNLLPAKFLIKATELLALNAIGRSTGPDEFELISKAGDHIWVEITTTPIMEQGKVVVLGFVRDISNRKKAADNLRIKDKAIALSINAIAMTDMNGVITYVNESFLKLWGYHKEKEVLKKPIAQFYGDKTQISEMFNTINNRGNWIGELTAEKRNGSVFHVQLSASIVTDESDIPIQIMTACVDITDRKQIEDSLRQSEERYRSLYELSPLGISILDMKGIIKYCNPAIFKNGGYSEVELIGKHFSKVAPLKFHDVPRLLGIFKSVVMGKVAGPLELSYTHKDGSTCWTEIYAGLLKANGKNIGIQVVQKDITETKQAEQALIQSEGRFKTLAEQSPNMIFIFQDNQIVYANFRCEEITGYNREEFYDPNFSFFTLITPESVEIVRLNLEKCKKGKDVPPYEYRILTKDGKKLEALINTRLFTYNGKPAILGTVSDVTEYKNALERLRDSENKLNLVFDSVDDGIIVTDIMGKITQVNESAVKMHGYARKDELLGQQLNRLIESKTQDIFMDNLNKIKHLYLPQTLELCLVKSNGDTYPAQANVAIMSDERCNPVGFVTVIEDITERRKMEKDHRETTKKILGAMKATIEAVARTTEMRDPYTAGHQRRVAELSHAIAKEMGLSDDRIEGLRMAGIVHDIGKVHVPAEILNKYGDMNEYEFNIIKMHSQTGYDILKNIDFPWPIAQTVLQHHERLNGSGYPAGITGDQIITEAKIIAVADVVEAMASHRPYRPALGLKEALNEISRNKGILYDPTAVEVCIKLFKKKMFTFDQDIDGQSELYTLKKHSGN